MICTADTKFEEVGDDAGAPRHSLRPVPLNELQAILVKQQQEQGGMNYQLTGQTPPSTLVDVIGIITEYGEQQR